MTANKKGIFAQLKKEFKNNSLSLTPEIQVGRVTDIILNGKYPKIEDYGGINGIGTIFFELNDKLTGKKATAKPFFPQISAYPLVNELVLILELPNSNIAEGLSNKSFYYVNMISLWNHPHHNAYPNPQTANILPPEQQKDYEQTDAGSVRRVTDSSTEIDFNSEVNLSQATFEEKTNIHPLLPFAGDIIHEGRWGNSIRFGSTANPNFINPQSIPLLNNWSKITPNGNPITIIRNGQPKEIIEGAENITDEGWKPITENIDKDLSSIYLTSNQKVPMGLSNQNYAAFKSPKPKFPFTAPQVLISSDRLVFNAKTDSILASAQKTIFLGANSSINFATRKYIVDAEQVFLGKNADQSIIKGDKFLDDLEAIMNQISALASALKPLTEVSQVNLKNGKIETKPALNGNISATADNLIGMIEDNFLPQFRSATGYKSNVSKTL